MALSRIINRCFKMVLVKYHSREMIRKYLRFYTAPAIIQRAQQSHVYTVLHDDIIVGTGTISLPSQETSLLEGIYIDPDYEGYGFGRKLIESLEQDAFYSKTNCTELYASGFGAGFYRHLGYRDWDILKRPDIQGVYGMYKFHTCNNSVDSKLE